MDLISKLLLYSIMASFIFFLPISVHAGTLRVEKFSMPIKLANKISQPINLSFMATGNWKLIVQSLDNRITNQDYPNCALPITRLELAQMSGTPITNFDTGKTIEIKSGDLLGVNNLNLALNTITYDSDRPGNYVADIKFTLIDKNSIVAEDIYSLRFMKDEITKMDFSNRITHLKIDRDKILQKNSTQNLPTPLGLYISSNKDWKLYIRKLSNSSDKKLSYFVKVLGGDQSINYNQTPQYIPMTNNPILLASGKATINNVMNCLDKKLINIDYMIKGPENEFIPAGSRSEEFEYRLETEH